jgi:hypothetical protein
VGNVVSDVETDEGEGGVEDSYSGKWLKAERAEACHCQRMSIRDALPIQAQLIQDTS